MDTNSTEFTGPDRSASSGHVGALLRTTRMRLNEPVEMVADILRIRLSYLEAIEDGRYEDLPGPAYAVGFVRAYADHLGLHSEEVVRRFKEESQGFGQQSALEFPAPSSEGGVPAGALVVIALVLAACAYGSWYWISSSDKPVAELIPDIPDRLANLIGRGDDGAPADPASGEGTVTTPPAPTESARVATSTPAGDREPASSGAPASSVAETATAPSASVPASSGATAGAVPAASEPAPSEAASQVAAAPATAAAPEGTPAEATAESAEDPEEPLPTMTTQEGLPTAPPPRPNREDMGKEKVGAAAEPVPEQAADEAAEPAGTTAAGPAATETPAPAATATAATAPAAASTKQAAQTASRPETAAPAETEAAPAETNASGAAPATARPATAAPAAAPEPAVAATAETPETKEPEQADEARPPLTAGPFTSGQVATATPAAEPEKKPEAAAPAAEEGLPPPPPAAEAADAEPARPAPFVGRAAPDDVASRAGGSRVVLRATADSWIQIRRDGDLIVRRLLRRGDVYAVPSESGLRLNVSNAGALEVYVDGRRAPALGPVGGVRNNINLVPDRLKSGG